MTILKEIIADINEEIKNCSRNSLTSYQGVIHKKKDLLKENKETLAKTIIGMSVNFENVHNRINQLHYDKKVLLMRLRKTLIENYILKEGKEHKICFTNTNHKGW